jgi:hypothetical protein
MSTAAFEGMGVFDLTGPLTVFWSASTFMKQQGTATPGIRSAPPAPYMRAAEPNVPESSRAPGSARRRGGHSCSFN